MNESKRLQALAEVAGGIQGQSTAFLPGRYIDLCRRIFSVSLRGAPHVCTRQAFSPAPGASADHMPHAAAAMLCPLSKTKTVLPAMHARCFCRNSNLYTLYST